MYQFKPTKQRRFNYKIYGFDIETYGKNNKFYCASIFGKNYQKVYNSKKEIVRDLKSQKFRNSYIVATNLLFDYYGAFENTVVEKTFSPMHYGSSMLWAKGYADGQGKFYNKPGKGRHYITFLDTLNYAKVSVESLGKLIGIRKLEKPSFLGRKPKSKSEREELLIYNMRDSEVSYRAMLFLFESFHKLGASQKMTIASTSMSIFRNKYLNTTIKPHSLPKLSFQFKSYYGGRCEAFSRGMIKKYNYYDVNSLYPSVMRNEYPDPDTLKISTDNTVKYIENYEGMTDVIIECPYMKYPLLPYRTDKLIFPIGEFRGVYTNVELRKALDLGYIIKKVKKSFYFEKNITPFNDFVNDMYKLRLKNKSNPMGFVTKIIMNSLYGKFGQKFGYMDKWVSASNITVDELKGDFERIASYFRIKKYNNPAVFCIPAFASYTTAYARLKLYEYISRSNPVYCDTDSIITKKDFGDNKNLGKMKLEGRVKFGYIIKPKMYAVNMGGVDNVKIKGIYQSMDLNEFKDFLNNPRKSYIKFIKFKESLRRGIPVNSKVEIEKLFSLEDNKRYWEKSFTHNELNHSEPLRMVKNEIEKFGYIKDTESELKHKGYGLFKPKILNEQNTREGKGKALLPIRKRRTA